MYSVKEKLEFNRIAGCVRALSLEAIEKAASGHPGLPLGCAEIGTLLYADLLQHNPKNPSWKNRDRFVLSGGHGSMLLYSMLHMSGYDLSMDDIKGFRVLGSKCPGHPENDVTPGVETTTGPLGQGLATAVGMAIAQKHEMAEYGVFDNCVVTLAGDGDMMEGLVHEAISYAGMQKLDNLVVIYDSNNITIDGTIDITFPENTAKTYEACGWNVLKCSGYDYDEIAKCYQEAKTCKDKPTLIIAKTLIGKGAPHFENQPKAHAGAMGKEEIAYIRSEAGLPLEEFTVPEDVYEFFAEKRKEWQKTEEEWTKNNSEVIKAIDSTVLTINQKSVQELIDAVSVGDMVESRTALSEYFDLVQKNNSSFLGGTADLNSPCLKTMKEFDVFNPTNRKGNFFNFGVREHAMAAMSNGMKLYEPKYTIYCSTFLSFVDYLRPALRLSAIMNNHVIYNLAYDSIFIGEDGPTHQPVEQLPSIRCMPNLSVIRPGDAQEGIVCAKMAVEGSGGPVACITTRQKLECYSKDDKDWQINMESKGAYIVKKEKSTLKYIVVATGSEVSSTLKGINLLQEKDSIRFVSMPCRELFLSLSHEERNLIVPQDIGCAVVEAAVEGGWNAISDKKISFIGLDTFGASAPGEIIGQDRHMDYLSISKKIKGFASLTT